MADSTEVLHVEVCHYGYTILEICILIFFLFSQGPNGTPPQMYPAPGSYASPQFAGAHYPGPAAAAQYSHPTQAGPHMHTMAAPHGPPHMHTTPPPHPASAHQCNNHPHIHPTGMFVPWYTVEYLSLCLSASPGAVSTWELFQYYSRWLRIHWLISVYYLTCISFLWISFICICW